MRAILHLFISTVLLVLPLFFGCGTVLAQSLLDPPGDHDPQPVPPAASGPLKLDGLTTVARDHWDANAVRKVLQAFAFGGHASEAQIRQWAAMAPHKAVIEMLNFSPVNEKLSAPDTANKSSPQCLSLTELQDYWSSDAPSNPMRVFDRPYYALLNEQGTQLSPLGLYLVWARAMHTRGCNLFLHKTAFYLTNYHASIHIQNTGTGLIRDYYDDTVKALTIDHDFVRLMYHAARSGALAFAYGHMLNYVHPDTGEFYGNDDFAREYFQLLFGIQGATEDEEYHERVSIENNARLLTGMFLDSRPDRFDSQSAIDWFLTPIVFTNHTDEFGREIYNRSAHFDFRKGASSCLEILHEPICGATADQKLRALGPVAAAHPESMSNTPLKIIRFFADTTISPEGAVALQSAWADADYDLLKFIRAYAVSTLFHQAGTFKYWSAFDRNLIIYNANQLDNQESFARPFFTGPIIRMFEQGALAFSPTRDVFGGQTGNDAANDRYVFKNAWNANVDNPDVLAAYQEYYRLEPDGAPQLWQKDWGFVIPPNEEGEFVVAEVADWLWNRFIPDGGENFDIVAQAQVHSLLATGFDFAAVVDRAKLDAIYTSADILDGPAAEVNQELAKVKMNFSDPREQERVGMAVNFISMMPYSFASGGRTE